MKKALIILPVVGLLLVTLAVAETQNIPVSVNVLPYYSVVFNYYTVDFGSVAPSTAIQPAPGNAQGEYNVTVDTNVPLDVIVVRTDWTPSSTLMSLLFNTAYDAANLSPGYYVEVGNPAYVARVGTGTFTHYHGYWIDVPMGTSPGTYSTTVTITYQPAA